jgi:hypothetical protein
VHGESGRGLPARLPHLLGEPTPDDDDTGLLMSSVSRSNSLGNSTPCPRIRPIRAPGAILGAPRCSRVGARPCRLCGRIRVNA